MANFGEAVKEIKAGRKVTREVWKNRGIFVFLVPGSKFNVSRPPLLGLFLEGTEISYLSHIDIRHADGTISPWSINHEAVLAEDWIPVD